MAVISYHKDTEHSQENNDKNINLFHKIYTLNLNPHQCSKKAKTYMYTPAYMTQTQSYIRIILLFLFSIFFPLSKSVYLVNGVLLLFIDYPVCTRQRAKDIEM